MIAKATVVWLKLKTKLVLLQIVGRIHTKFESLSMETSGALSSTVLAILRSFRVSVTEHMVSNVPFAIAYYCYSRCCRTAISKLRFCFLFPSRFFLVEHRYCHRRYYRYRYCSVSCSLSHLVILLVVASVDVAACCSSLVFFLLLLMLSLLLLSSLLSFCCH